MKTKLILLALISTLNPQLSTVFAQGSLTPPGAPAATMKSLAQIEPRTPVDATHTPGSSGASFIINQPGSYYLTTNLVGVSSKDGIEILTNNVTLDLNGFTLSGVSGSWDGINIPNAQTNIVVRNGTISGWGGGGDGVDGESSWSFNQVFEHLNISTCGYGMFFYGAAVVRDCNCENNATHGIVIFGGGIISGCTANNNGATGIDMANGMVLGCFAINNSQNGILVAPGTVSGCFVQNNKYSGIYVDEPNSTVIANTCIGNNTGNFSTHAGICINDSNNRVEDNHVTGSGHGGIQVNGSYVNNVIIKNSVSGNGANNYVVPAGNDVGPVGVAATATSPWANISH